MTAALGGILAQDIINVLGKREQPIQNMILFDGEEYQAPMYALHPIFNDGMDALVAAQPMAGIAMPMDGAMNGGVVDMTAMAPMDPSMMAGNGPTNGIPIQ